MKIAGIPCNPSANGYIQRLKPLQLQKIVFLWFLYLQLWAEWDTISRFPRAWAARAFLFGLTYLYPPTNEGTVLIDRLFHRSAENPANPISFDDLGYGADTGEVITRQKSLRLAPYYRALDLISGDIAKLPLMTYKRESTGKQRATGHQAYHLLRYKANDRMTAHNFKRAFAYQALCGNGYAHIRRVNGRVQELILLDSAKVTPVDYRGALWYVYETGGGSTLRFEHSEILHMHGLAWDGVCGYDSRQIMGEAIASGLAVRKYGSKYFSNNARPSIVLEHPGSFKNNDAAERLRKGWERMTKGLDNSHRAVVLEEGLKANAIGVNAADAQLVEAAEFNLIDVALFFGIPPHKLGHSGRTSYNSLEQENQAYLDQCLDHWLVQLEQECRDKLLSERQKAADSHVIEFNREALLEADVATKAEAIQKALGGAAWMTVDEARGKFNMGAMGGKNADLQQPANHFPTEAPAPEPEPEGGDEGRSEILKHAHDMLHATRARMVRRLAGAARRAAKHRATFDAWATSFAAEHRDVLLDALGPICRMATAAGDARCAATETGSIFASFREASRDVLERNTGDLIEPLNSAIATIEKEFAQ